MCEPSDAAERARGAGGPALEDPEQIEPLR